MKEYKVVDGDITSAQVDFICHQVNCQGKMGSGVALAIRNKYPNVYEQYLNMWSAHRVTKMANFELLGLVQYVQLYNFSGPKYPYYCVNMYTQDKYGSDGKSYTSTDAFKKALLDINEKAAGYTVAFPWKVGCVRGGADWDVILPMICETLTNVKELYFYKLDKG